MWGLLYASNESKRARRHVLTWVGTEASSLGEIANASWCFSLSDGLRHMSASWPASLKREFDSLFVCEHTHIPVSRRKLSPSPVLIDSPGVVSSLALAEAGMPRRWKITARTTGARFKMLRERVLAMQALWTQDKAEFRRPRRGAARARSECAARARSDMNARTHVFRTKCDAVPWFDLSVAASECTPMESIEQRVLGCSVHRDRGLWARGRGRTAPANWRRALWVHRGEEIARRV
jgi:hypothetical protein